MKYKTAKGGAMMELAKCKCGRPLLIDDTECEVCIEHAQRVALVIFLLGCAGTALAIIMALGGGTS